MTSSLPATVFPKDLTRLPYLLRIVIVHVLSWLLGRLKRSWMLPLTELQLWELLSGGVIITIYSTFFVILPRLRDSGLEWWYVLLSLVPILDWVVQVVLAIQPSKAEIAAKPCNPSLEPTAGRSVEWL